MKGEIQVEKGVVICFFFEGFGPCSGISHLTHPHLGEISQKKRVLFGRLPLTRQTTTLLIYNWVSVGFGITALFL